MQFLRERPDLLMPQPTDESAEALLRPSFIVMLRPGGAMEMNLPVSLIGFVGQERELNELGRLLRQTRLVTLTGPGCCGKTRLAIEVARPLLNEQPQSHLV